MIAPAIIGDMPASEVIAILGMKPHPEGGWYVETFRAEEGPDGPGGRGWMTAILFLLEAGDVSHWHRVDSVECWFWQAGGPLALSISTDGITATASHLGPNLRAGQKLQGIVPAHAWQAAETLGAWTLVSCTVAPGFQFEGFELAPADWFPGKSW
jgi:uncharacterized protein